MYTIPSVLTEGTQPQDQAQHCKKNRVLTRAHGLDALGHPQDGHPKIPQGRDTGHTPPPAITWHMFTTMFQAYPSSSKSPSTRSTGSPTRWLPHRCLHLPRPPGLQGGRQPPGAQGSGFHQGRRCHSSSCSVVAHTRWELAGAATSRPQCPSSASSPALPTRGAAQAHTHFLCGCRLHAECSTDRCLIQASEHGERPLSVTESYKPPHHTRSNYRTGQ